MGSKLINLIKQIFEPKFRDAIADPRSALEKSRDYTYGEDMVLPTGSAGNKRIKKLPFDAYLQQSTSSCGAHAAAHARRSYESEGTFPLAWYRTRTNYSGEGMYLKEVLKLAARADTVKTPKDVPKKLTESYANSLEYMELFSNNRDARYEYVTINPYDAQAVLDLVSGGKAVVISFYATKAEWGEEIYPRETTTILTAPVRHYVLALPNTYHTKDGYEWVSCIDSANPKGNTLVHMRRDMLEKRMYLGGGFYHVVDKSKSQVKDLPLTACEYGQRNGNVLKLQKFLTQLGRMSAIHNTGYYGNITAQAVLGWQVENLSNADVDWLYKLNGHYWGPQSIVLVKKKYE